MRFAPASRARPARPANTHQREVMRGDSRWLVMWLAVFSASLGLLVAIWTIYRATGPHPEIDAGLRWIRREARSLVPGLKRSPHARTF
jgi:hypothetical protein